MKLTLKFVKRNGPNGGDWMVRITGDRVKKDGDFKVSFLFYAGAPSPIHFTKTSIHGLDPNVKDWQIRVTQSSADAEPINKLSFNVDPADQWQIKDITTQNLLESSKEKFEKSNRNEKVLYSRDFLKMRSAPLAKSTVKMYQHMFFDSFKLEYSFSSGQATPLIESEFDNLFNQYESDFDQRFEHKFRLSEKDYSDQQIAFSKTLLSNMLGGIGYFHGKHIVDRAIEGVEQDVPIDFLNVRQDRETTQHDDNDYFSDDDSDQSTEIENEAPEPNPMPEGPFTLFSGVPSRPFFPRGFLWDSGFDQLLLGAWDSEISLEILSSWMNRIDKNGWIAREQILGDESKSKVPEEFQTQYSNFANPPTLIFGLDRFLSRLNNEKVGISPNSQKQLAQHLEPDAAVFDQQVAKSQIELLYPKFKRHYEWFKKTQWGETKEFKSDKSLRELMGFRWRGKRGVHILTSGF
jgi:mannosyl-oligosaccharide glucosidase